MKVIYTCIEEKVIENVIDINYTTTGILVWTAECRPDEYTFISNECPYSIILDGEMDIRRLKIKGKIDLIESLISDIDDSIDDYMSSMRFGKFQSEYRAKIAELSQLKESYEELKVDYEFQVKEVE